MGGNIYFMVHPTVMKNNYKFLGNILKTDILFFRYRMEFTNYPHNKTVIKMSG